MRIATVRHGGAMALASRSDESEPWRLIESQHGASGDMVGLIRDWANQSAVLQNADGPTIAVPDFCPPLSNPSKIICIGKNYADHAREMGSEPPEIPVVFSKFASAIVGPGDAVVLPSISKKVDFEAELVVVIGKRGRHIDRQAAREHVFGFCCGNDISARDWQKEKPGGQWLLGKTFDTFAPIGPWITTADSVADWSSMNIELTLNGETMQSGSTSQLIFGIEFLVEHVSKFFMLEPGDLIFTGTPKGVGAGRTPPLFLKSGDQLAVEISGLGKLENPVISFDSSQT